MFQDNWWAQRLAFSAAAGAWMALIFFLSSLEGPQFDETLKSDPGAWTQGLPSYLAHAFLYGALAVLVQMAIWGWNPRRQLMWVVAAAVFAAFYGITDEYHQSFVAGRSASMSDVVLNSVAALGAASLHWAWSTRLARPRASGS